MPCGIRFKFLFLFFLSVGSFISVFYLDTRVKHDLEYTVPDYSSMYLDRVKKLKDPYPPLLLGAYESGERISVSVASLLPIGYTVYCRYFDEKGTEHEKPMKSFIYPLFVVLCDRKSSKTQRVAITDTFDAQVLETFQKEVSRPNQNDTHFLTHCVAPIYGNEPKWLHLVEMIEHYKLQGVTKMYFYVREIDPYDMQLLQFYATELEQVEIIVVPSIYMDAVAQQLLAIADCHLRNKISSNWTIFSDIDERIVMTEKKGTISEFLNKTYFGEAYGAVMFAQRWILKYEQLPKKFVSFKQVMKEMPTRKWITTTRPAMNCAGTKHCWGKMIINNRKVLQMLVHDVGEYEGDFRPWVLDPDVGYIRHYRDVNMKNWLQKNQEFLESLMPFENTTYSEYFKEELLSNVLKVLHEVYKP